MRQTMSGLLLLVLLAGCGGSMPTGPSADDIALDVEWSSTVEGDALATIAATNESDRTIGMGCPGIWLEIETTEGWVLSKSVSCAGVVVVPLAPGKAREISYEAASGHRYRIAVRFSELDGSRPVTIYSAPSEPGA